MVKSVNAYVVGDGSQPATTHGPIQNSMQYARVKTFFDDIEERGWKAVAGGKIEESAGYFIHPTIIDNPPEDSRIVVDEPFGKILPYLPCVSPLILSRSDRSPSQVERRERCH
jgi:acyl-CoA reductase-like NAD-dependent aldehyde dehydrogenase